MNWKKVFLGSLYELPSRNGLTRPSKVRGVGYKMINMGELFANEWLYDIPMERVQLNDREKRECLIAKNDLLFARQSLVASGAGKCSIVREVKEPTTFESHLIRVRLDTTKAVPLFYYYYFKSPLSPMKTIVTICAQAGIRGSDLATLSVECPDLPTQRRIASILSAYDDLIENNRRQIKLLEEAAQRLYREWFVELRFPGHEGVKVVDGVPEGWMKGTLNTIAEFTGKKANKAERERYKCYLPIDCLPKKSLAYINHDNISNAESSLLSFAKYDIIFGAMRPYFHKVVIAQEEGLTRSTCFVINSRSKEYWSYVCMLLFSEEAIDYATHVSVGTTMPYVRWKDFERMPVLIPSQKVAAHFHEMLLPIIQKISCIAKHIALLSEARDRLLPKLMSGEMEASE